MDAALYYFIGITTAALVVVVYFQFKKLHESNEHQQNTTESEFLLRIDERWTSKQILKARTIIYDLYLSARDDQDLSIEFISRKEAEMKEEAIRMSAGNVIKEMSENKKEVKTFMCLLNLLDFMETVSFLHNTRDVSTIKLGALLGESLKFHYQIFEPYIRHKRKQPYSENIYGEFSNMIEEMNSPKSVIE